MSSDTIAGASLRTDERWHVATLESVDTIALDVSEAVIDVPTWPGHRAGQYVDVRLPDAGPWDRVHSYSIANPPSEEEPTRLRLAVPSGALVNVHAGRVLHIDGPKGTRMAWDPAETDDRPLLLIGGGTGIVPLLSIAQTWCGRQRRGQLQLIYSVRSLERRLYGQELDVLSQHADAEVATIVTGDGPGPSNRGRGGGRLSALDIELFGLPPALEPECFVCGPASFVESVTRMLVQTKHQAARIRTEWEVSMEDVG